MEGAGCTNDRRCLRSVQPPHSLAESKPVVQILLILGLLPQVVGSIHRRRVGGKRGVHGDHCCWLAPGLLLVVDHWWEIHGDVEFLRVDIDLLHDSPARGSNRRLALLDHRRWDSHTVPLTLQRSGQHTLGPADHQAPIPSFTRGQAVGMARRHVLRVPLHSPRPVRDGVGQHKQTALHGHTLAPNLHHLVLHRRPLQLLLEQHIHRAVHITSSTPHHRRARRRRGRQNPNDKRAKRHSRSEKMGLHGVHGGGVLAGGAGLAAGAGGCRCFFPPGVPALGGSRSWRRLRGDLDMSGGQISHI
mmetsp:Transcript_9483/g.24117  ORF Transcript_9483/g.24117 Transcript_9483/m.24117 type:complete len:302 (-) Transcript_9483:760-1665(-)